MANHKSALKRAGQNQVRRLRNRAVKTRVKNVIKEVREAADAKSGDMTGIVKTAQSALAKAAKKGVLHRRTASRKISRLAKLSLSVKP